MKEMDLIFLRNYFSRRLLDSNILFKKFKIRSWLSETIILSINNSQERNKGKSDETWQTGLKTLALKKEKIQGVNGMRIYA